jgi:hypothetical protein
MNPALVVAGALTHDDLDVRLVESLPWVLSAFPALDWEWRARSAGWGISRTGWYRRRRWL